MPVRTGAAVLELGCGETTRAENPEVVNIGGDKTPIPTESGRSSPVRDAVMIG
jgi:hypothetical protein